MTSDKNLFDDLARMAGGAASLLSTVRRQIRSDLKERAYAYTSKMDLADRDEVERLQATVSKFRLEQEELKKRIAELEAASGQTKSKPQTKSGTIKKKLVSKNTKRK